MFTLGKKVRISLFGKSHSDCIGCILEGIPPGISVEEDLIKEAMDLRRPSPGIGTERRESDEVVFETGVSDGKTTGTPILIAINNSDLKRSDYSEVLTRPRPGHADLPALMKYGEIETGGGPFSGRLTAPLVAAGVIAESFLFENGIRVSAHTDSVGSVYDDEERDLDESLMSRDHKTRACTKELDSKFRKEIESAASEGDSIGGTVKCIAEGLRTGFGGIWFEALDSEIASAVFSIPGVKGIEFGKGFELSEMRGSESNDQYFICDGSIASENNNMGGILGGMSDGMPLEFRVAFKPTASISKEQSTVDVETMETVKISVKGRHDPCIVPRAAIVVESVTALVLADQLMRE